MGQIGRRLSAVVPCQFVGAVGQCADNEGARSEGQGRGPGSVQRRSRDEPIAILWGGDGALGAAPGCLHAGHRQEHRRNQAEGNHRLRGEGLGRQVTDTLRVGAIAMRDETDHVAIAAGTSLHRAREPRRTIRLGAGRRRTEMPRLIAREVLLDGKDDGLRKIDEYFAVVECHAGSQRVRSITAPQCLQVRSSRLLIEALEQWRKLLLDVGQLERIPRTAADRSARSTTGSHRARRAGVGAR